ncbi:hypothetical protein [Halomonas korlensis]|uniref:Group 4 capsule polysaccharide lipoprotein gfcB, YjbF n=1 Tax=Halomonas korlensis TaxID=463301 RepID=A0A1I7KD76_9GAMM|nr:hypothetical protein [Halomonas korlensis]SFU95392.1 Group 4 capsule polysaccharide lipoprotein gfcB, YjbF [Halomonas korlensis]
MRQVITLLRERKSRQRAALSRSWRFFPRSWRLYSLTWRIGGLIASALVLGGCASGGVSPQGAAIRGLLPGDDDINERAEAISFASLIADTGDRSGLVVLGAAGGPATFWPTGNNGMLSLYHDGLQATAGLRENLLSTRYAPTQGEGPADYVPWQQETPVAYRLERLWEDADGLTRALGADARLNCESPAALALPLGEQQVERCVAERQWDDGRETQATLWRDPSTRRLWAVDETPWPGGPRIHWEVARPWW